MTHEARESRALPPLPDSAYPEGAHPVPVEYERGTLYTSRPQHVEAVQWDDTDEAVDRLWEHTDGKVEVRFDALGARTLYLLAGKDGAQEMVPVPVGHWVVHPPGDVSDIWPVEDGYFRAKYEAPDSGSPKADL